jgi:uncharacterized protein (TIGR02246 family)
LASQVPQKYVDGLNSKDAEAVANLYAKDAVFIRSDGEKTMGRDAIRKFYEETFRNRPSLSTAVGRVAQTGKLIAFEVIVHDSPMGPHGQANALDFAELDDEDRMTIKHVFYPPGRAK